METTLSHNISLLRTMQTVPKAGWQPCSWRRFPVQQLPQWPSEQLRSVEHQLAGLPPLTGPAEIEALKSQIAAAGRGERFVLHAGDCAERFRDCNADHITGRLRILSQMSLILASAWGKPITRLGRMAGQYAKPRTELLQVLPDRSLVPAFRGESVNEFDPTPSGRIPDPARLLQAYHYSGATLNFMRTLWAESASSVEGLTYFSNSPGAAAKGLAQARYAEMARKLREAKLVIDQFWPHQNPVQTPASEYFVSHEALLLPYEEAMTRQFTSVEGWYNTSTHFVWIGERTRQLDGAHVEYCRGIANPVGIKVSAEADPGDIVKLLHRLNPWSEHGKVTLITRFGASLVERHLPRLIRAVRDSGCIVTWSVDPMHGNTRKTSQGLKTRRMEDIVSELRSAFEIHRAFGSILGGVHLELTHEMVTECVGGWFPLEDKDLHRVYETWCDPRLNGEQSLELAFTLGDLLARER